MKLEPRIQPAHAFKLFQPEIPGWNWGLLPGVVALIIGLGSLGFPLGFPGAPRRFPQTPLGS